MESILACFKLNGLSLKPAAADQLLAHLSHVAKDQVHSVLDNIIEAVQRLPLESSHIDIGVVETVFKELAVLQDTRSTALTVINVFTVPKFNYSSDQKKFLKFDGMLQLHGNPQDKTDMYVGRYYVVQQRLVRHPLFSSVKVGTKSSSNFRLRTAEELLSISSKQPDVIILGMITQLKEDKFFIEDPSGVVQLDLSRAVICLAISWYPLITNEKKFHFGLFTENSFVLVEGLFEDDVLRASAVGFPPIETAEKTRVIFGNINFFGGVSACSVASSAVHLKQLEQDNGNMFVFISDLWLDQPKVLTSLEKLFAGYAAAPPFCFVFCGSFSSVPTGTETMQNSNKYWKRFVDILAEHPSLLGESHFVFVPSLQDPVLTNICPRPPLPLSFTSLLRSKIPNCHLATNPCRIQYCSQEIVVFREDLVHKMCRNTIRMPSTEQELPEQIARTLLSQSNLYPLPLHVSPVHWTYDHCLRLYPIPDLLVIADKYNAFIVKQHDCIVINPGSFARNNFAFKSYIPATREVEDCVIPLD